MTRRSRFWVLILVAFVFVLGIRAVTSEPLVPHPYFDIDTPIAIAHQGGDGLRPGNTLLAFQQAALLEVDALEMDVHSTRDGVLVVNHDATVDRTTNGSGAINEMSFDQLQNLDAAYRWPYEGDAAPYRGTGVRIPRLRDVLTRFRDFRFVIEIKQREPAISGDLCLLISELELTERAVVASFHTDALADFRERCPRVATSAYPSEVVWFLIYQKLGLISLLHPEAHALQLPMERYGISLAETDVFEDAASRGMHVDIWTINDPETMADLARKGVGGIITDRPDLLMEVLRR